LGRRGRGHRLRRRVRGDSAADAVTELDAAARRHESRPADRARARDGDATSSRDGDAASSRDAANCAAAASAAVDRAASVSAADISAGGAGRRATRATATHPGCAFGGHIRASKARAVVSAAADCVNARHRGAGGVECVDGAASESDASANGSG